MASPLWKIKPPFDLSGGSVWLGPGAHAPRDGLWLGSLAELGPSKLPQVWLSTAKEQVVAVVGKRGSGKSFTLGVIAEGLALGTPAPNVAKQSRPRATLLFDPLDVYWTTRFAVSPSPNEEAQRHYEIADTSKLAGLQFNVEAWVPGVSNRRPADPSWFRTLQLPVPLLGVEEWELLLGVNMLNEPMGQALTDSLNLVGTVGYRRKGTSIAPIPGFDLGNVIDSVQSDELEATYHPETLRALRQRLSSLQGTGLFSSDGTPISSLLAPGRLTVILLGRLPQSYRAAVVAVVTRMLVDNRVRVAFAEKRRALDPTLSEAEKLDLEKEVENGVPRTIVALDEAQTFLAPGVPGPVREVFVRLVKEGRNIGLSAVIATQQPSALDQRVLSQVETFVAHQLVTDADVRAVRDNLKSALPEGIEFGKQSLDISGLLRTLSPGQCLVSSADMNTTVRRSLVMSVRPRATIHGGIEL
jgi:DNA helicase HerA-like ATPase